jgi:hypothetical protein
LAIALCVAAGALGALELGARWWQAGEPSPHSYDEPRNPRFRRGWMPFTAPRSRPDGRPLILVLSNSQGFLREQEDGSLAYSARLAAGLAQGGIDAIVANWSVPAAQGPELVVLAARAAQHAPDLVVVSAGTRAFGARRLHAFPLSYWLSDVTDLAYARGVRSRLPPAFLARNRAYDPVAFLRVHSAFVRSRELLKPREEISTWRTAPNRTRHRRRLRLPPPDVELLRTLVSELATAVRAPGDDTPLLLVNMPICRDSWFRGAYRRTQILSTEAADLFAGDPHTRVVDARAVVPDEHFTSATHLNPTGHQLYADWLLPHVLDVLDGARPPALR